MLKTIHLFVCCIYFPSSVFYASHDFQPSDLGNSVSTTNVFLKPQSYVVLLIFKPHSTGLTVLGSNFIYTHTFNFNHLDPLKFYIVYNKITHILNPLTINFRFVTLDKFLGIIDMTIYEICIVSLVNYKHVTSC